MKKVACMLLTVFLLAVSCTAPVLADGLFGYMDELAEEGNKMPSFSHIMEDRQPDREISQEDGSFLQIFTDIKEPIDWWRIIYELKFLGCSVGPIRGTWESDQSITILYHGIPFHAYYHMSDETLEIIYPEGFEIEQIFPSFWINGDFSLAGKSLFFGSYEQDNDYSNGSEPIEWTIADRVGDRVLLVSKYILDAKPYNDVSSVFAPETTWDNCSLRRWLNSDFSYCAFTEKERKMILPVMNITAEEEVDEITTERITLIRQADFFFNPTMGFDQAQEMIWKCGPTPYATARGVHSPDCFYWAAGAGKTQAYGSHGMGNGGVSFSVLEEDFSECDVFDPAGGVRPLIWITLSDAEDLLM